MNVFPLIAYRLQFAIVVFPDHTHLLFSIIHMLVVTHYKITKMLKNSMPLAHT